MSICNLKLPHFLLTIMCLFVAYDADATIKNTHQFFGVEQLSEFELIDYKDCQRSCTQSSVSTKCHSVNTSLVHFATFQEKHSISQIFSNSYVVNHWQYFYLSLLKVY